MPPTPKGDSFRLPAIGFRRTEGMTTFRVRHLFSRRFAAGWILLLGLSFTAALGWELRREALELDRQRLIRRAAEIQSQLDTRLEKSEMLLHNLRDYLTWSGQSSEKDFQRWCYANGHTINSRWLAGIALATNRTLTKWPENVSKSPRTWGEREMELLTAAALAQPIECDLAMTSGLTNTMRFVADYDLRGVHGTKKRFANTIQSSRLGMSEQQIVMQDPQGNGVVGTCFYVPLFQPDLNAMMAELMQGTYTNWGQRALPHWFHFTSIIVAPVDYGFLAWTLSEEAPTDVEIEMFSSTNQTAATWLSNSNGLPRAVDPQFKPYLDYRQTWSMYGVRFSIYFYTTPLFEAQSPQRLANVTMAAGLGITLLATALVGVSTRARLRQDRLNEQIREARDALSAAHSERNRISRDLHDGTIQSLYAIQLGLGATVEKLTGDPSRAGRGLSAVRRELDIVIAEIRQFITTEIEAEPSADLSAVLHALRERAATGTTAQIELNCDSRADHRLMGNHAVQLANIVREALSNSLRHAAPSHIEISLRSEPEAIVLQIADDGAGFDPQAPPRTGVGLGSMASRAREIGGTMDLQTAPGKGTRVTVRVPVAQEQEGTERG